MSGGDYLRDLASRQCSFEETSQRWRAIGDSVSDLISPGIEPYTSRTDSMCLTTKLTGPNEHLLKKGQVFAHPIYKLIVKEMFKVAALLLEYKTLTHSTKAMKISHVRLSPE